jgi:hypothetical protein
MSKPEPKEIREAFTDYRSDWEDIRDEGASDMLAISPEGPWSQADRKMREDNGRPCLHLDQINQFLNQVNGNVRKNKRAIKAIPKGNGANEKNAEQRSSLIMGIEERSMAQPIYLGAFQCMTERSYGYSVIRTEYEDENSFDQGIIIKPIPNPDTVLISPHYKQSDASDIPEAFLLDRIPRKEFKRKYPDARVTDFDGALGEEGVSDWVNDRTIQIAEYWRVECDYKTLLLVESPEGPIVMDQKQYKDMGLKFRVIRDRRVEIPKVVQYWTNGLEILDEIPWAGSRIPIISCLGPERWITRGGKAERQLLSMVRFARDPQMLFDFLATQECEEAGMVPKVPFIGYKGQFESDKDAWEELNKVPHAYVQSDIVIDGANGQVLPHPDRPQYIANFQQYELAKDSAGRSLQTSMGIAPLPTAAQRANQKSGVALERIDDMENLGSTHFVDRYENGYLHNMGWQINELITPILDTQREMPISEPDGSRAVLHIVGKTSHPLDDQGSYDVQGLDPGHLHTAKGEFGVTISTGPNYQSEREEQSEFVNTLIDNMANLPQPGTPGAKILALGIHMRPNLGPIGKQMADVFDPPDPNNVSPEAQAIIAPMQQQLQQLQQENMALHADRAGRVLEQQTKVHIEQMRGEIALQSKNIDYITQIVKAQLASKSRSSDMEAQQDADKELSLLGLHHDQLDRAHQAAHDVAMQQGQQAHERNQLAQTHEQNKDLADQTGQQALVQQAASQETQGE